MDKCNIIIFNDSKNSKTIDICRIDLIAIIGSNTLPFLFTDFNGIDYAFCSNLYNSVLDKHRKEVTQKYYGEV